MIRTKKLERNGEVQEVEKPVGRWIKWRVKN